MRKGVVISKKSGWMAGYAPIGPLESFEKFRAGYMSTGASGRQEG